MTGPDQYAALFDDEPVEDDEVEACHHDLVGMNFLQEQNGYCFAAVEQLLRRCLLNQVVSQDLVAHEFARRFRESGASAPGNETVVVRYNDAVDRVTAEFGLPDDSWDTVGIYLDDQALALLHACWGLPNLARFSSRSPGYLDEDLLMATINAGGLVLVMEAIHYKVVFGYHRAVDAGEVALTLRVYDPMNNTEKHLPASHFGQVHLDYLTP